MSMIREEIRRIVAKQIGIYKKMIKEGGKYAWQMSCY